MNSIFAAVVAAAVIVNEGSVATNQGSVNGATSATASAGKVTISGGMWHWSMPAIDGPAAQTITIRSGGNALSFPLTIRNVAPSARFNAVARGRSVKLTFKDPYDPSTTDRGAGLRYGWSCHGESPGQSYRLAMAANRWTCAYDTPGRKVVAGRVFDKDGGFRDYKTIVNVSP